MGDKDRAGAEWRPSGRTGVFVDRRRFLSALSLAGASFLTGATGSGAAEPNPLDIHAILDDPDAPVGGNPDGDVTIVAYVDYNCPFCKRSEPDLQRFVSTDGQIRLVYKDWPILAKSSVTGARLALAAKYQGKYQAAHAALMALHGRSSDAVMRSAVATAGVDGAQLEKDLDAHGEAIMDLIRRNGAQADALHVQGTPVYLIGPYIAAAALTYDEFADAVAKFRAHMGK